MFYIYCEGLLWIIKFLSAQAEWMHITECPLVSTVSALSVCTSLRMSAFCCVSCKINHCNYETWAVTGFTRNMSMCPWMFNKRAALALRYSRRREIFMRGGSSPRWGWRRGTGNRARGVRHPLCAPNLPGQALVLWRNKSGCGGQWGDVPHLLLGQYCLGPALAAGSAALGSTPSPFMKD